MNQGNSNIKREENIFLLIDEEGKGKISEDALAMSFSNIFKNPLSPPENPEEKPESKVYSFQCFDIQLNIEMISRCSIGYKKIKNNYSLYIFNTSSNCFTPYIYNHWKNENKGTMHILIADPEEIRKEHTSGKEYYFLDKLGWLLDVNNQTLYLNKKHKNLYKILPECIRLYFKPLKIKILYDEIHSYSPKNSKKNIFKAIYECIPYTVVEETQIKKLMGLFPYSEPDALKMNSIDEEKQKNMILEKLLENSAFYENLFQNTDKNRELDSLLKLKLGIDSQKNEKQTYENAKHRQYQKNKKSILKKIMDLNDSRDKNSEEARKEILRDNLMLNDIDPNLENKRIFISYAHDKENPDVFEEVRLLSAELRNHGLDCWIDQYEPFPEEGWPKWMEKMINRSDYVLIYCTELYNKSISGDRPDAGRGISREFSIVDLELYINRGTNKKFIPIIAKNSKIEHIPSVLRHYSNYKFPEDIEKIYRYITDQHETPAPLLGEKLILPSKEYS